LIAPVLQELALHHAGRLKVVTVDVDANPLLEPTLRRSRQPEPAHGRRVLERRRLRVADREINPVPADDVAAAGCWGECVGSEKSGPPCLRMHFAIVSIATYWFSEAADP
jgi:hypothetical protein